MRPNIEVMCIVKFQYATSAMLALPYDHFLVSLLFLDVPITVIVPFLLLTSFFRPGASKIRVVRPEFMNII